MKVRFIGHSLFYNEDTTKKRKGQTTMKVEQILYSQILKTFLDFVDTAQSQYNFNLEAMKNEERITQDYLHRLELEGLNCRERSKIATQLAHNRQARRNYKDAVEELEPIVEFFEDPKNRSVLNAMSQLLGQVRKVESYHQKRFYVPKVIDSDIIPSAEPLKKIS